MCGCTQVRRRGREVPRPRRYSGRGVPRAPVALSGWRSRDSCARFALARRSFAGKSATSALLFSPLVIPYLVFGISLLLLFTFVDKVLTDVAGVYTADPRLVPDALRLPSVT